MISPSLLNPVAVNIAKTLPVTTDPCGRTIYGLVADQDENLVVAKMDYQISDKNSFFGRFMSGDLNQSSTYDGKNPLSINTGAVHDLDYGVYLGRYLSLQPHIGQLLASGGQSSQRCDDTQDNYASWAGFGANIDRRWAGPSSQSRRPARSRSAAGPHLPRGRTVRTYVVGFRRRQPGLRGRIRSASAGASYQQRLNYFSCGNAVGTATFTRSEYRIDSGRLYAGTSHHLCPGHGLRVLHAAILRFAVCPGQLESELRG